MVPNFVQSVWDTLYSRISAGVLDFSFRCLETCIQGQSCNLGIYENGLQMIIRKRISRERGRTGLQNRWRETKHPVRLKNQVLYRGDEIIPIPSSGDATVNNPSNDFPNFYALILVTYWRHFGDILYLTDLFFSTC